MCSVVRDDPIHYRKLLSDYIIIFILTFYKRSFLVFIIRVII